MESRLLQALVLTGAAVLVVACGGAKTAPEDRVQELSQQVCTIVASPEVGPDNAPADAPAAEQTLDCGGQKVVIKQGAKGEPGEPGEPGRDGQAGEPGRAGEPGPALTIVAQGSCQGRLDATVLDQQKFARISFYAQFTRFSSGLVFSNLGVMVVKAGEVAGQTVESPRMDSHDPAAVLATDIVNGAAFQLHMIHPDDPAETILQLLDSRFNPLGLATCKASSLR